MNYTVTGKQMKEIDRCSIREIGIPAVVLMERAALEIAAAAETYLKATGIQTVVCICGSGNNGADGIAAGRILFSRGVPVQIVLVGDLQHQTEEHRLQTEIAGRLEIPLCGWEDWTARSNGVLLIDALFGIGLSRAVQGVYREAINRINRMADTRVIAADIPSGIHADTGEIMGDAVKADVTVTFGYPKTGQLLYPGKEYCGTLLVKDIGFPPAAFMQAGWDTMIYDDGDRKKIPDRPAYSNKGTYGKVLVVAGSAGMSGAAYLSSMAAYRMGAGLVKILTVEKIYGILQGLIPEALIETYSEELVMQQPEDFNRLLTEQLEWATVIVLGPGLGTGAYVEKVVSGILAHAKVPLVLDADGLNTVARYPYLTGYFTEHMIVTPHLGEMARLTGKKISEIRSRVLTCAREYAGLYGITCVLKDAVTAVADKDGGSYLNTSGCSALAKGGAGDVLAGIIAGLLAIGMEEGEAAGMGVYLHGRAGEKAAEHNGIHGVTARDILTYLTNC